MMNLNAFLFTYYTIKSLIPLRSLKSIVNASCFDSLSTLLEIRPILIFRIAKSDIHVVIHLNGGWCIIANDEILIPIVNQNDFIQDLEYPDYYFTQDLSREFISLYIATAYISTVEDLTE